MKKKMEYVETAVVDATVVDKEPNMIQITVRLKTSVCDDGGIFPGICFPTGTVKVTNSLKHGIINQYPIYFHSILPGKGVEGDDLASRFIDACEAAGIKFIPVGKRIPRDA